MVGGALWGDVMAAVGIVSGIGALNGWTMVLVASTALAPVAVLVNYVGSDGQTVFRTLILMTGITSAIPYVFSALAQITGHSFWVYWGPFAMTAGLSGYEATRRSKQP